MLVFGCINQSETQKILKRELENKNEFNDLIFDMKIGQSRQDYFDICSLKEKVNRFWSEVKPRINS